MALQDRSNGSNFKTKGSGDSFSKPYSSTGGGEVTPPVTNRLLRYALDQSTLIQRFMSHHMPMGWMLLPIEKYSSIQVSSDRKKYTIELDLDDTEYSDFAGFKQTNIPYLVILEAVNLEDSVIQGMVNNTLPFAELAFETDNTNSNAWDGSGLSEIMFNYLGKWYFAISRTAFRSVSGFRTLVTATLTIGESRYAFANLSEYISIKDSNEEELGDFDYAVIRYIWTSANGKDLDTRTRITTPPRNVDVGWSRSQNDLTYLTWGGDNRADGVEAVLIDVKSLIANYGSVSEFIIALRAFWYSIVDNGRVKIEFESYKGGTMQKQGYNFVNVGGVSIQTLSINNKTFVQQPANLDGEQLATIYFNPTTKTGRLVIEETGSGLVPFNNFRLADDTATGNVKVTFNNPSSNTNTNAKLTVWRRSTPFNGSPAHADWWEDLPKPASGDNLYIAGGDAGQTVYYAFALTNPADNTAILNPVALVTVVFPSPIVEDYSPVSNVVIVVEDI